MKGFLDTYLPISFSLSDVSTIPGDLFYYIDISDPKAKEHYLEIKKLKPTRILMYDDKKNFLKLKTGQLKTNKR